MKVFLIFFTLCFLGFSASAEVLECVAEDSNYSINFSIDTDVEILTTKSFSGTIYANVNDDAGEVTYKNAEISQDGSTLLTVARSTNKSAKANTLFGALIDLEQEDGLYYGVAYMGSGIDGDLPSDNQLIERLTEGLNDANASGVVSCTILK